MTQVPASNKTTGSSSDMPVRIKQNLHLTDLRCKFRFVWQTALKNRHRVHSRIYNFFFFGGGVSTRQIQKRPKNSLHRDFGGREQKDKLNMETAGKFRPGQRTLTSCCQWCICHRRDERLVLMMILMMTMRRIVSL